MNMNMKDISAGPWGGSGGTLWDDGVYTCIRQIILVHGEAIESVKFEYDRDGSPAWSERHGGVGENKTDKIELDYPKEILISMSGHYGPISQGCSSVIRSLTFESNLYKYGPYGVQHGTYFSFSKVGGKIVGFHGQSGLYLDCIGMYISNSRTVAAGVYLISPVLRGPWGGSGGTDFQDGVYTGVRQIVLSRGAGIASIKVEYDRNGQSIWGNRHGGSTNAFKTDRILFDYPSEILTSITGYYGTVLFMGPTVIKSLTFQTTRRNYGPYGEEQGTFFSSKLVEGMITGFHGRKGWYLDAIGVHVLEGQVYQGGRPFLMDEVGNGSFSSQNGDGEGNNMQWTNKSGSIGGAPLEEVAYGVVREPVPLGPGPWGGEGGKPWDDGVFSGIKQIIIMRGEVIHSIQVEYDRNGQSVWSMRHGGSGGETTNRIKFDYPNEVLTCVSGYHCRYRQDGSDPSVIRSLSFYSSRGKYGPFGEELGTFFTSAQTGGKIVGFHGKSGVFLDAIGVHMQHWLGNEQKPSRSRITRFLSGS